MTSECTLRTPAPNFEFEFRPVGDKIHAKFNIKLEKKISIFFQREISKTKKIYFIIERLLDQLDCQPHKNFNH